MKNYTPHRKRSFSASRKPLHKFITVTAEECHDNPEKMIRRFIKKVKSAGILEEARSRTHFKKPSEERREKKRERKRLIQKVNKQREELFKPRESNRKSFRNRR